MKKVELLCPVGNMDMLLQAVHNGADAVYLAGKKFGARKFANNFDNDELIEAIKYCHLYGVKVYATVNTMIYDSEVSDVLSYLEFLHINGVDAVIMQDIGIIKRVREIFPNLEIHASTQCHNHNEEGIKLLKYLGVTRVVMAREMSLDEINSIPVDIEKEVFVYGALCVCYSGCCLFSSMNGGRSGNRGECVGSCRLPYKLLENDKCLDIDNKYLLSTRDLNTINNLKQLLDSNIDSLKIEGRMKSSEYVGYVTRIYRKLIDNYYNNKELMLSSVELNNLKKLFNREFTSGYLFSDSSIMNTKSPNHIGVRIGSVIKVDAKYIYIKLDSDNLYQEDGIRFKNSNKGMIVNRLYNDKYLLVSHIDNGNIAIIDNKFGINKNDIVLKTIDNKLINDIRNYKNKVIDVFYDVKAKVGEKLVISINDGINSVSIEGNIVDKSINMPTRESDIARQLSKLGNSPFIMNSINYDIDDNIFISLRELNNIRRSLVSELISIRENKKRDVIINKCDNCFNGKIDSKYNINVLVRNEEQLLCCIDNNIDNIYITDYILYCKYKDKYNNIFYRTSRVNNCNIDYNNSNLLVGELGGIYKYSKDNYVVSDYYLNVANRYSIELLSKLKVNRVTLSVELSDYEIESIMSNNLYNVEIIIYGRVELMVMKYCPLKELINNCSVCKNNHNKYYLLSKDNKKYPIIHDNCLTHIMHDKNIDKISSINNYKNMNIKNYRIELFDENKEEVSKLINDVKDLVFK